MAEAPTTTQVIPLKDIREQMLFMKDGSLRAVLDVSAINFELRSSEEQLAIIQQFQNFLNSIDFTIQIVVQSRKYDIEQYLQVVQKSTDELSNEMLKLQAEEYIRFVRELSDLSNIMSKKFYVVIPLEVSSVAQGKSIVGQLKGFFAKKKGIAQKTGPTEQELGAWRQQLAQRADLVSAGLSGMSLRPRLLDQVELTDLFTSLYNPEVPSTQEAGQPAQQT